MISTTTTSSSQSLNKKQKKSNNNNNDFPEFFVDCGFKLLQQSNNENDVSIVCDDFVKSKRMLIERFKRAGDLEKEQMLQNKLKNWFSSRTKLRKLLQPIITSNQDQG